FYDYDVHFFVLYRSIEIYLPAHVRHLFIKIPACSGLMNPDADSSSMNWQNSIKSFVVLI
ncbi:hypothetical protein, partial [Thiolapillus sp.]|uniref:hypothetical protein n=1 Tax=Thiolapillus sp. TaxID=2017437 RepID=UPI003AF63368